MAGISGQFAAPSSSSLWGGGSSYHPFKAGPSKFGVKAPLAIRPPKGATPINMRGGPVRHGPIDVHGGPVFPGAGLKTTAPSTMGGPTHTGTTGSTTGTAGSSSGALPPLDAQSAANIANYLFKANQSTQNLAQQEANLTTGYQAQQAQLAHQQPLDELRLMTGANARGGLDSSAYGQQLGNLNYSYLGRQGANTANYNAKYGSLASKMADIAAGIPIYEGGQAEAAAGRESALAAKNPASGTPPTQPPAGSSSKGGKGSKGAGRGHGGRAQSGGRGGRVNTGRLAKVLANRGGGFR